MESTSSRPTESPSKTTPFSSKHKAGSVGPVASGQVGFDDWLSTMTTKLESYAEPSTPDVIEPLPLSNTPSIPSSEPSSTSDTASPSDEPDDLEADLITKEELLAYIESFKIQDPNREQRRRRMGALAGPRNLSHGELRRRKIRRHIAKASKTRNRA